ncbi:MAG: hypothetical protein P1U89_13290 [Verrucomicrobiales bacterium]|nr:hypothetical protein [Verrucomicrobiales bacterium]
MRQLQILFGTVLACCGFFSVAEAQQEVIPNQPSNQLDPIIPAPADANIPSMSSETVPISGTLQTTTVQSQRIDPNVKVSADRYYEMLGTTGSYRVNTDRAKQLQEEALQRARRQKKLKEDMSAVRHYRLPNDSASAMGYLQDNPPHSDPTPLTAESAMAPEAAATGTLPPGASYPDSESAPAPPPEPQIEYVDMRKPGMGTLADKIRSKKAESTRAPSAMLEFAPDTNPFVSPESNAPMPPSNAINSGGPPPKRLFSRFRKESSLPELQEPTGPSVTAAMVTDTPPAAAYPTEDSVPTFATFDSEPGMAATQNASPPAAPPERKSLFSGFGRKKSQTSGGNASQPSIFRPNVSARKADSYSVVRGNNVYARVNGEEVKLSPGTRVRVLREGTERSLVRLYDDRQATIANASLVTESE